ncbi:MAG: tetratricopeptide repeat protein [Nonlabens sp.]
MRLIATLCFLLFMISTQAQINDGDKFLAAGQYASAIAAYERADSTSQRFYKTARVFKLLGNNDKAITNYKLGFELDPLPPSAPRFEYGKLLYATHDLMAALQVFNDLIQEDPVIASYHYHQGKVLAKLNDGNLMIENEAGSAFAKALQVNPQYRSACIELIKSLLKKREYQKAYQAAQKGLLQNPDDVKMNSLLAQTLLKLKEYAKATEVFNHLFTLGNDTEFNRKGLALSYFHEGKLDESLKNYERFLADYNDRDHDVYFMISKIFTRQNKLSKAQDYIERAIVFKTPRFDQEYLQLASIYALKKDYKNAYHALKKASKENPSSEDIAYQVAIAADRYFKKYEDKVKAYQAFVDKFPYSDYSAMATARVKDLSQAIFMSAGK